MKSLDIIRCVMPCSAVPMESDESKVDSALFTLNVEAAVRHATPLLYGLLQGQNPEGTAPDAAQDTVNHDIDCPRPDRASLP